MKKIISLVVALCLAMVCFIGCGSEAYADVYDSKSDKKATINIGDKLAKNQPTPTDIDYSLERYNLIKRAYWVNGQREKAMSLPCAITRPLGYIVLFSSSGAVVGRFIVDGKVSSLNSWLTPDYYYTRYSEHSGLYQVEMPDVDGTYGTKTNGIFFFTTDGKYIEWTGDFLYSDIPFTVEEPILKIEQGE